MTFGILLSGHSVQNNTFHCQKKMQHNYNEIEDIGDVASDDLPEYAAAIIRESVDSLYYRDDTGEISRDLRTKRLKTR